MHLAAEREFRQRGVFTLLHISKCRFLLKKIYILLYHETLILGQPSAAIDHCFYRVWQTRKQRSDLCEGFC